MGRTALLLKPSPDAEPAISGNADVGTDDAVAVAPTRGGGLWDGARRWATGIWSCGWRLE